MRSANHDWQAPGATDSNGSVRQFDSRFIRKRESPCAPVYRGRAHLCTYQKWSSSLRSTAPRCPQVDKNRSRSLLLGRKGLHPLLPLRIRLPWIRSSLTELVGPHLARVTRGVFIGILPHLGGWRMPSSCQFHLSRTSTRVGSFRHVTAEGSPKGLRAQPGPSIALRHCRVPQGGRAGSGPGPRFEA